MKKLLVLFCIINSIFLIGQTNYVKTAKLSYSLIPNVPFAGIGENLERTYPINSDMYIADDFNHLTKIDSNYNVIYSKTFGFPLSASSYSRIAGLAKVTNNRLVMGSKALLNNKIVSNVTFINSINGSIIWSKTIDSVAAMSIKYKNNKISLFCCLNNYNYLINLDTNGNLISTKKINLDYNNPLPGPPPIHSYSLSAGDVGSDSSFFFLSIPTYSAAGFKVTKLDKNENILWSYEYKIPNQYSVLLNNSVVLATNDGGLLIFLIDHGTYYKINKNGKMLWQNNQGSFIRYTLFEKPDGKIFSISQNDNLKLFDANGTLIFHNLSSCFPKSQDRIIAPFQNHFIFIYPIYSTGPFSCLSFSPSILCDAVIYKNDYSFSGCLLGTTSMTNNLTNTATKGDSSISFHPYTPSLTPLSYSISSQTPTITITNDACNPAGIKENALNGQASIYPNPSSENLTITTKNSDIRIVSIINSIGQHITTIILKGDRETIDISDFATGLYFINCYSLNNELIVVQKIIKN